MTTMHAERAPWFAALAVAFVMAGAGAIVGAGLVRQPTFEPRLAALASAQPEQAPGWQRSETRMTFTKGDARVEVRIVEGELEARVNGELVGEERIERQGGTIRILDDAGETIVTLRQTPEGGWSIDAGDLAPEALRLLQPRAFAQQLAPAPPRPRLGVTLAPVDERAAEQLGIEQPEAAALIRDVSRGSAAAEAGLQAGDVILAIDGDENMSPARVVDRVAGAKPGEEITLRICRDGQTLPIPVKLAGAPRFAVGGQPLPGPFGRLPAPWGELAPDWDRDEPGFRLFPDDFISREPLAEMDRILREIERLRRRLREDFEPFGFVEREGPGVFERLAPERIEPPGPFRFDFDNGFMNDFHKRMEAFQERMQALGAQMGEIGRRIAAQARADAGPALAEQARGAFTRALAGADDLGAGDRADVERAFERALERTLDNAHWRYDSGAGAVELSQQAEALARQLRRRFTEALENADVALAPGAAEVAMRGLRAAAAALAGARATLSDDARKRIDALFEQMRELTGAFELPGAPGDADEAPANDSPEKKDAKQAAA